MSLALEAMQSPWNKSGMGQHVVDVSSGDFFRMSLPNQFLAGAKPTKPGQRIGHPWRPIERIAKVVRQQGFLGIVLQYGRMGVAGDAQRE